MMTCLLDSTQQFLLVQRLWICVMYIHTHTVMAYPRSDIHHPSGRRLFSFEVAFHSTKGRRSNVPLRHKNTHQEIGVLADHY